MEHDRRLRGCLRAAITKMIAALEPLLQDSAAPEHRIKGNGTFISEKQTELRALHAKIQAELSNEAFQADYATAWDNRATFSKFRLACAYRPFIAFSSSRSLNHCCW